MEAPYLLVMNFGRLYRPVVLAGQNSGPLQTYTYETDAEAISVEPNVSHAPIHLKDVSVYKHEFPCGGSYLSQSSRKLMMRSYPPDLMRFFS